MVAQSNCRRVAILLAAHRVGLRERSPNASVSTLHCGLKALCDGGGGVVRGLRRSMMAMQDPPHPGGIVKRQCLEPLGLSVTRAARGLGVTRQAMSELVNERAEISVDMAIRLSKAFGATPETWLGMRMAYDLWQARERADQIKVESFASARSVR